MSKPDALSDVSLEMISSIMGWSILRWSSACRHDMLIFSKDVSDHMVHVKMEHKLKISLRKCKLFQDRVAYMGHTIMIRDGRITCQCHCSFQGYRSS